MNAVLTGNYEMVVDEHTGATVADVDPERKFMEIIFHESFDMVTDTICSIAIPFNDSDDVNILQIARMTEVTMSTREETINLYKY